MRTEPAERRCDKPSCGEPAAASLSFRYATGEVWIGDLADPHPSRYELCARHAEQLTVPRGWERVDERSGPVAPLPSPPAHDGSPSAAGASPARALNGAAHRNRYAALSAALPRLAAEVGAGQPGDEPAHGSGRAAGPAAMPSRELLPTPPDAAGGGVVVDFDRTRERRDQADLDRDADADAHADGDPDDPPDPAAG